jgi:hypothetical protein
MWLPPGTPSGFDRGVEAGVKPNQHLDEPSDTNAPAGKVTKDLLSEFVGGLLLEFVGNLIEKLLSF